MIEMGILQSQKGDLDAAVQSYLQALEILKEVLGNNHQRVGYARILLGQSFLKTKAYDEAESALLESYSVLNNSLGESSPRTRLACRHLVQLYLDTGNTEKAARWQAKLDDSTELSRE